MYWKNLDKIWVIVTHLAAAFLGAFLISFLFVDDVQYQDQKLYQLLDIIENRLWKMRIRLLWRTLLPMLW